MSAVTYAYMVRFSPGPGGECFAWHWHPTPRPDYHLHVTAQHREVGDLSRLHVPAGPVSFAAVVRFLIDELDVLPLRADWASLLAVAGDAEGES